jgi:hypothetical protein
MGSRSAFSLLLGAVLGWALLGPMARASGWATGPIGSFESGAQGWVITPTLTPTPTLTLTLALALALTLALTLSLTLTPRCSGSPSA